MDSLKCRRLATVLRQTTKFMGTCSVWTTHIGLLMIVVADPAMKPAQIQYPHDEEVFQHAPANIDSSVERALRPGPPRDRRMDSLERS